ncbi:hypothetical protein Tco_0667288 [Tanacetum coccineum]
MIRCICALTSQDIHDEEESYTPYPKDSYAVFTKIKQSEKGISINQEKYVKDLLKKYDINGSSVKISMHGLSQHTQTSWKRIERSKEVFLGIVVEETPCSSNSSIMDPNMSIGQLCLGADNRISLNDGIDSNGEWATFEYHDTMDSGKKKELKSFTFYRMETNEHEMKNKDKVVKKELIVALRGELYFVKFIINPEEGDIKPGVVFGRSFLRLTKGIVNFGNGIKTVYTDLEFSHDDYDNSDDSGDDWDAILKGVDFGDIPKLDGIDVPPYVCNMGRA